MKRGISGDQIIAKEIDRGADLVLGDYIGAGETLLLYAPTGQGKTINALMLGISLTCGVPFYDWKVHKTVDVLFVEGGELTAYGIGGRMQSIYKRHGITSDQKFHLKAPTPHNPFTYDITDPAHQKQLLEYIDHFNIKCAIFDNYNSLRKEEESEFHAWQRLENFLNKLKIRKVCSVIIHHTNKEGKQQSGAQRKADFVDCVIRIQKSRLSLPDKQYVEFEMQKFRWGPEAPIKLTEIVFKDNTLELVPADYEEVLIERINEDREMYSMQYVKQKYSYLGYELHHYLKPEPVEADYTNFNETDFDI